MNIKKIIVSVLVLMMVFNIAQGMNLIQKPGAACSICLEEEDCYVSTCHPNKKDAMCMDCRKGFIAANIDKKVVPLCPVRDCINVIDPRTMQNILKNDHALLNRCNTFLEEKRKREAGIKPCPTPNCTGEFNSRAFDRSHYCNSCRQTYCSTCEFNHTGMTCDAARAEERRCIDCDKMHARNMSCEAAEQDRTKNNTNTLRNKNCQKCPGCKAMIFKDKGCNHITCEQCRHQFCWICLSNWTYPRICNCGQFQLDHGELAEIHEFAIKTAAVVIGATSIAYIGYTTVYQTWNQKRKLDLIAQTAEQTVEKILAIEFELFDENNSLLTLQEQFDIDSILKFIKSDEKRDTLWLAIEAYDVSLKAVHDVISSVKYYHQTPEYFAKNEPVLIQNLYTDLDALKQILSSCQSEISVNWKKLIGMSGLFACAAVGAQWYYFDR